MTNASCMLRFYDTFFNSLAKFAIQIGVGSTLEAEAETSSVHRVPLILALPQNKSQTHCLALSDPSSRKTSLRFSQICLPWWPPTSFGRNSSQLTTIGSGILRVATPRNAFFNSSSKFAIQTGVVSCLEAWLRGPCTLGGHHGLWDFWRGIFFLTSKSSLGVCFF